MTFDAAEIAKLRERAENIGSFELNLNPGDVLALLDELEKARDDLNELAIHAEVWRANLDVALTLLRDIRDLQAIPLYFSSPIARIAKLLGGT